MAYGSGSTCKSYIIIILIYAVKEYSLKYDPYIKGIVSNTATNFMQIPIVVKGFTLTRSYKYV